MSALDRVTEYLRQFDRLQDTGGQIHWISSDPKADRALLSSADLREVLELASRPLLGHVALEVRGGTARVIAPQVTSQGQAELVAADQLERMAPFSTKATYIVAALVGIPEETLQAGLGRPCEWYALCTNEAVKMVPHPVLGEVPTCQRCIDKHDLKTA